MCCQVKHTVPLCLHLLKSFSCGVHWATQSTFWFAKHYKAGINLHIFNFLLCSTAHLVATWDSNQARSAVGRRLRNLLNKSTVALSLCIVKQVTFTYTIHSIVYSIYYSIYIYVYSDTHIYIYILYTSHTPENN